jgi:antitoxin PrlF
MEAILAERGQIVIPKAARDELGLVPGMKLDIRVEGGKITIRKDMRGAIERVRGRFKHLDAGPENTDELMRDIRGRAPTDPIEAFSELRDDVDISPELRAEHAERRKAWLAEQTDGSQK